MLTEDEIQSKARVLTNEASSEHARSEAATSLIICALMSLQRIAAAMERRPNGKTV